MDNRGKRLFVKSNVMIGMILSCFGEVLGHFEFQWSSIFTYYFLSCFCYCAGFLQFLLGSAVVVLVCCHGLYLNDPEFLLLN